MDFLNTVDPEGRFVWREDGVIVFAFGDDGARPVDDVATTDPGFLE
jgi:hypothetical protein